jgi:kynurenine formamidase
MKKIWLSYPLSSSAPRPPAIPAPSLSEFMSIKKDGASVLFLQCYNHTGTHLDTAAHVIQDGMSLDSFEADDLIYTDVRMVELHLPDDTVVTADHIKPLKEQIRGSEAVIFCFSVADIRKNEPERFSRHCPGFSISAAEVIFDYAPQLRLIGTDVPSIACINKLDETMKVHNYFFEHADNRKFIIIEEMKLDKGLINLREMIVSPWLVENMDSGPCVIWGEME